MIYLLEYILGFIFLFIVYVSTFNFIHYIQDIKNINRVMTVIRSRKIKRSKFEDCLHMTENYDKESKK